MVLDLSAVGHQAVVMMRADWRALRTYGEARRLAEQPADNDPYDLTDTPEYTNGDWPAPAATLALGYLPEDLDDLGTQEEYFPNFPTLDIDPEEEAEILRTVRARGYELTRDDLISRIG